MTIERRANALSCVAKRIAPTPAQSTKKSIIEAYVHVPLSTASLPPRWHKRFQRANSVLKPLRPLHVKLT